MNALPDYIVIDFLNWLSARTKDINTSTLNRAIYHDYAESFLKERALSEKSKMFNYEYFKNYFLSEVYSILESDELMHDFDLYSRRNECLSYYLEDRIHRVINQFFRNFSNASSEYSHWNEITPHSLVDSTFYYLRSRGSNNGRDANRLFTFPSHEVDMSLVIDFLNWFTGNNINLNLAKIPIEAFEDLLNSYENERHRNISGRTKRQIIKSFKSKDSNNIVKHLEEILPRNDYMRYKSLAYIMDRYINNRAKYKCMLLPVAGETELEAFVKRYWADLDSSSADKLDIYYSPQELSISGYITKNKLSDLMMYTNELPCIVLWDNDISSSKTINIGNLSSQSLFALMTNIIANIEKDCSFEKIHEEAIKMADKLRQEDKTIQKIEQNIYGNNYGAVTGINKGTVENYTYNVNQQLKSEIETAKSKILLLDDIDDLMKNYICRLLDETGAAINSNDEVQKKSCFERFTAFLTGAGKVSASIIKVIAPLLSIASFFGIKP